MGDEQNGSWRAYRLLITETQERHEEQIEKLRDEMRDGFNELRIAVHGLKIKSSLWGALSGTVVALGIVLLSFAKKIIGG